MRYIAFVLVIIVVVSLLILPVYAAGEDDEGIGGILGFLSDIFSAIGDFFSGIFDAIWNAIKWLLEGIKALFIPRSDYFPRAFERIKNKFSEKFGGIVGLSSNLTNRFNSLRASRNVDFALEFPAGHLLNGLRLNLLGSATGVISMIRGVLSGFIVLLTFAFCYRRVISLINA